MRYNVLYKPKGKVKGIILETNITKERAKEIVNKESKIIIKIKKV